MKRTQMLAAFAVALGTVVAGTGCASKSKKEYNDVVDDSMNARSKAVQGCFKSAQAQGKPGEPKDSGEIELSLNVSPQGKVTHVSVIRSTMNSKILEDCVTEVARRAEFPKADDGRVKQFTRVYKFGTQATPAGE